MCLAVPAKIVALTDTTATADLHGNRLQISTLLTPDVVIGDYVLVHAGFAIQKLNAEEAAQTFSLLADAGVAAAPPSP